MSTENLGELMADANRAHAEGRLSDCARLCDSILSVQPGNVAALVLAGVAATKQENTEAAISYFARAIQFDPTCAPAYLWLSMAHRRLGHTTPALMLAREAVARNPNDPLGLHHLGLCFVDAGEFRSAETQFMKALAMAPNVAVVHYGLGLALQGLKRNSEAIAAFRRSAKIDPSSVATHLALRKILTEEGEAAGAVQAAREILRLQPQSAEANVWLARALIDDNKATEAETYLARALELEPDSASIHTHLGSAFQIKGQLDEADAHFRRSIELSPEQGAAYLALATNRKIRETDRTLVDKMLELTSKDDLSLADRSQFEYALGKALEDLGEYEAAMHHLDEANRITREMRFGSQPFDPRALDTLVQAAKAYTSELFAHHRVNGSQSERPIFVLGMMRSGTTLAEQILSSHPLVGAAGELRFWLESGAMAVSPQGKIDFPMLVRLAERYDKLLQKLAPGKARVVDKMPTNYQAVGLIHLALPHAKIVHMRRHPIDTCLSIYATPNRSRLSWGNDKGNIVLAYETYLALMNHWRTVLPEGTMMDVQYEDIVSNPEPTIRSLIEFCGLEWNDACLHPERNERNVNTPSIWQVRQPLYKTSVARWRKFEPWLGSLARLGS